MKRTMAVVAGLTLAACGPVEVRIDETKGVPALKGSTEVTLGTSFTCGQTIPAGSKMVSTRAVSGGCEFTFDDSIPLLSASDYSNIPELKAGTNLVQRVELTIKKLALVDGSTSQPLDLQTRVTSLDMSINGQKVADKATIASLPSTVTLSGAALTQLKSQVDARSTASVGVKAIAVLPTTPAPPEKLSIDYEAQPALIIGPGEVKLF